MRDVTRAVCVRALKRAKHPRRVCAKTMRNTPFTLFRCSLTNSRKTKSSTYWLQRQRKDVLVKRAVVEQYRCRSAFKLIELDDKYHIFRSGAVVIDCGARPGSWSQVAAQRIGTDCLSQQELVSGGAGLVLSIDIGSLSEIPGAITLGGCDIHDPQTHYKILDHLNGRKTDIVMSDMAPNASGTHDLDHYRIMELCQAASELAAEVLCEGGLFLCKTLQGKHTTRFLSHLRGSYKTVRECRLKSTRKESTEIYVFAKGYLPK